MKAGRREEGVVSGNGTLSDDLLRLHEYLVMDGETRRRVKRGEEEGRMGKGGVRGGKHKEGKST